MHAARDDQQETSRSAVAFPGSIFLVGMMGAGKTSVGKLLARHLGKTFHDSDHVIETRTGVKIPVIFELEGEDGRVEEHELGPGEHRRIPVGRRHRFSARERVELVEVSTPELDDVVRLQDDFGRSGSSVP